MIKLTDIWDLTSQDKKYRRTDFGQGHYFIPKFVSTDKLSVAGLDHNGSILSFLNQHSLHDWESYDNQPKYITCYRPTFWNKKQLKTSNKWYASKDDFKRSLQGRFKVIEWEERQFPDYSSMED